MTQNERMRKATANRIVESILSRDRRPRRRAASNTIAIFEPLIPVDRAQACVWLSTKKRLRSDTLLDK